MNNLVAIVGRPNVGKSTLFNRLTKTRQAIVNEEAGTTRDRQYGKSEWLGREFSVVDTGGWVVNSDDIFEEEIRKQVLLAVEEADVILFVVDVMNGVTDLDMQVATIVRRSNSPVIKVANKTDNNELQYNVCFIHSHQYLLAYFLFKDIVRVHHPSSGIYHGEFFPQPFGLTILAISCCSCFFVHNSLTCFGQAVK